MKTLKRQIEDKIGRNYIIPHDRSIETRIMILEDIVIRLAEQIDNINHFGTFE